ncbi:hypothetical protein, partial [Thiolapillus sp.]|uniref:hypothetical protein n=1 Tax=Thiolapillus sp. TaxID=2017437 RepID=UPI003AF436D9
SGVRSIVHNLLQRLGAGKNGRIKALLANVYGNCPKIAVCLICAYFLLFKTGLRISGQTAGHR